MTWLILTLMEKTGLGKLVASLIVYGAIIGAAVLGYWIWIDRHDANVLRGYVQQSELDTAKAKQAETERQLAAGRQALSQYAELLAAEQAKNRAADEALEQEISAHEKETTSQGRSCPISPTDRDWLLKP
jgi:hypothetical protein